MMYLGTPGRMVAIKCPTTQRVNHADRYSFATTLGGKVKAQAGPVGRRTWDVSLGQLSTPSDVGALMDFAKGAWGSGPFWFVTADAPVVNLLTPQVAQCDPGSITVSSGTELLGTPPMDLGADGVAAQSVWKTATTTGTATFGGPVPVLPGQPVTGSAWVIGTGTLRLVFLGPSGTQLATIDSEAAAWSTPQRLAVTTTAPGTATAVQLVAAGPLTHAARPAVTWTNQPYEWGDGQGCPKAVVHNASRDVVKAWDDPRTGRWSEISFTVQEVG